MVRSFVDPVFADVVLVDGAAMVAYHSDHNHASVKEMREEIDIRNQFDKWNWSSIYLRINELETNTESTITAGFAYRADKKN